MPKISIISEDPLADIDDLGNPKGILDLSRVPVIGEKISAKGQHLEVKEVIHHFDTPDYVAVVRVDSRYAKTGYAEEGYMQEGYVE